MLRENITRLLTAVFAALILSFSSLAYADGLVNINTASVSELVRLPGIGQTRAQAIVQDRDTNGPFRSIDDLSRVSGIGPATMNNLRPRITVGDGEAAPADAAPAAQPESAGPPSATPGRRPRARGVTELDLSSAAADAPSRGADPSPREAHEEEPAPQAANPPRAASSPAAAASSNSDLININTAGQAGLTQLPAIGPAKARAILDYRESNGPFRDVEDLIRVPGIGPATMRNLRSLITVGDAE